MSFHNRLIEAESELIAKRESERGVSELSAEGLLLLDEIEQEIGIRLGDKAPKGWEGWITYRRKNAIIVCRGRSFAEGGMFKTHRVGLDVPSGMDAIADYKRGYDVSPPADIDHLLVNFGVEEALKVFLWYGHNIAPYKLIYQSEVASNPAEELKAAIIEACLWILKRPKDKSLNEFLKDYLPES
ncbi:MAG TPA: hypothetical protein V6C86_01260 [Oculatellaceae cyanobacterium]